MDDDSLKEDNDRDDNDERQDTSFKSFHLLNALSDLMMLPKDMLLSRSIRKEVWQNHPDSFQKKKKLFGLINTAGISTTIIVIAYVAWNSVNHKKDPYLLGCISHFLKVCPTFGAPLIKRVLHNFVTDEFCPDPIPDIVLEALESEVGDVLNSSAVFCLCSCCCQFGFILEIKQNPFNMSV